MCGIAGQFLFQPEMPSQTNLNVMAKVMEYFADDLKAFGYSKEGLVEDWYMRKDRCLPSAGYILAKHGGEAFNPWTV